MIDINDYISRPDIKSELSKQITYDRLSYDINRKTLTKISATNL